MILIIGLLVFDDDLKYFANIGKYEVKPLCLQIDALDKARDQYGLDTDFYFNTEQTLLVLNTAPSDERKWQLFTKKHYQISRAVMLINTKNLAHIANTTYGLSAKTDMLEAAMRLSRSVTSNKSCRKAPEHAYSGSISFWSTFCHA